MQKNPFVILGVNEETVTQSELFEAYNRVRRPHLEKRFEPGDVGNYACEMLDEIEAAYREANALLQSRYYVDAYQNPFQGVEDFIKTNSLDSAQEELDKMLNRNAEWHFYQSMIYFKKDWLNDARTQLKKAVDLEPSNTKYTEALANLERRMSGGESASARREAPHDSFYAAGQQENERSYRATNVDRDAPMGGGCSVCDCCSSLICADCCCECMGGDLISCC